MNIAIKQGRTTERNATDCCNRDRCTTQPQFVRTLTETHRDGRIHFFLQRVAGGLYVEREELPCRGTRSHQSIHFSDAPAFGRWCDSDFVRFTFPLLHSRLRRDAAELLQLASPGLK